METNCLDGQVLYEGTGYILTYSNRDSSFGIDVRSGREELKLFYCGPKGIDATVMATESKQSAESVELLSSVSGSLQVLVVLQFAVIALLCAQFFIGGFRSKK